MVEEDRRRAAASAYDGLQSYEASDEVASYAAGGFFGELALLNDNSRRAAVTATESTVINAIDRRLLQSVCGDAAAVLSEYAKER